MGLIAATRRTSPRCWRRVAATVPSRWPTSLTQASWPARSSRLDAELGPAGILVANAGIGQYGAFADITADEIERIVRVNVLGTAHAIRLVIPGMIERRAGHIVTLGSIAGRLGSPFEAIYSATKFAGVGLTEALVVELEPYGIGVSMVQPGPVATHFGEARGHPYDRNAAQGCPGGAGRGRRDQRGAGRQARAVRAAVVPRRRRGAPRAAPAVPVRVEAQLHQGAGRGPEVAMRGLVFGTSTQPYTPPPDAPPLLQNLAVTPVALLDIPDARPLRPDWLVTRPRLTGICGSDSKQILLDFGDGDSDNAMSGLCSFPQVMGHEVVAEVTELGPEAEGFDVGQRVVLNPWLSCAPRGISPLCPACQAGDLSLCWSFAAGEISTGIHTGVSRDATGGYAELMPAHSTMLFAVPDAIDDEHAIFADPFSVSLHSITRHPPPPGGRVLVWGAGSLGSCAVAILRALYPDVEVGVVARFDAQADLAQHARRPPGVPARHPARRWSKRWPSGRAASSGRPWRACPASRCAIPAASTSPTTPSASRRPSRWRCAC